jgi:hypothetical protein
VRGSSVASSDSGTELLDYGEQPLDVPARAGLAEEPLWNGSGGRWLAIPLNEAPSAANGTAATPPPLTPVFPVSLGSAYALQFGQVYLKFSLDNESKRARQLATYIPANIRKRQPEFGWNGAGTLTMYSESGEPAWLTASSAAPLPNTQVANPDSAVQSALSSQLPAFSQAYASGDQATLNRFLAPGASVGGLGGAASLGSIGSLTVPRGDATRDIAVSVNWVLPDQVNQATPQLAATYDMSVVDQRTGRWYVRDIRASTQPMGTQ